jgi:hypothetical protein
MAKIFHPLRFDRVRRASRNKKRRDRRKARDDKRRQLRWAIYRLTWFGIEPEAMWCAGDDANDNERAGA